MMHRLDPIRIQMRRNRLHALPLARQQQPETIAVQPLFLLRMVHRCGERVHVFVELPFFTALRTLCAHDLNIETDASRSAGRAMRLRGKNTSIGYLLQQEYARPPASTSRAAPPRPYG